MFTRLRRFAAGRHYAEKSPGHGCGRGPMLASESPGRKEPGRNTSATKLAKPNGSCLDLHQIHGSLMNSLPDIIFAFGFILGGWNGNSRHRLNPHKVVVYLFDAGDILGRNDKPLSLALIGDNAG